MQSILSSGCVEEEFIKFDAADTFKIPNDV